MARSTRRGGGGDGPYREYVSIKGIKVNKKINASIGQGGHALGVVLGGINMVDANRVDAEILHEGGITGTLLRVDEGIVRSELVGNTLEEEFCLDMVSRSVLRRQSQMVRYGFRSRRRTCCRRRRWWRRRRARHPAGPETRRRRVS